MFSLLKIALRLYLWTLVWSSAVLVYNAWTGQTDALPLNQDQIFRQVGFTVATQGRVVSNRQGQPSGVTLTVSGTVRNDSDRPITGLDMTCRWASDEFVGMDQGMAQITAPIALAPHTQGAYRYTYTYEHANTGGGFQHCFVTGINQTALKRS